ncbi:MAG: hypothetical protein FIA97_00615 [Methylococcaceae bacterium]|nr:hypothetical protein [Methylococcaceae bacterium]
MCYALVVSTTSDDDLSQWNTALVQFSRDIPEGTGKAFLRYPNQWYLGSKEGCSCAFRHLENPNVEALGFSEPVDWSPEDPEDIEATFQVVRIFRSLLSKEAKLDCVDTWFDCDLKIEPPADLLVDLATISESHFRFFEGYRFELVANV